jgi:hypothetical protein
MSAGIITSEEAKMSQRRLLLVGFVMFVLTSLACSLGGEAAPAPQGTPVVVVVTQLVPVQPQGTPGIVQPQPTAQPPIVGQPTITPQPAATDQPTATPQIGSGPGGCILNAAFVADVSIPDNTVFAPNAPFVKTWRIKNTGTCTWDAGYQFIFDSGNQLGGPAGVPINVTAPGANLDVSVNLKAPAAPAATPFKGIWTLKASNSVIFGGKYTVVIVVPLPPTSTPSPTGVWSGHWDSNCGSFSCAAVDLVQTDTVVSGSYVAGGATGTINGTVSGTHLKGVWAISGLHGKIDWWMGSGLVKWRGSFDGVNSWCGHRTGETDPAPCGVGTFNGDWTVMCSGCDGGMHIDQDGKNFTGTYVNGTVSGTIDGTDAIGHYNPGGGEIHWRLINYNSFKGDWGAGIGQWCGVRNGSGASMPSPCVWP